MKSSDHALIISGYNGENKIKIGQQKLKILTKVAQIGPVFRLWCKLGSLRRTFIADFASEAEILMFCACRNKKYS